MFVKIGILLNLLYAGYIIFISFKEIDKLWADYTLYDKDAKKFIIAAYSISVMSFLVFSSYEFTHKSHIFFALYNMFIMMVMYFKSKFRNFEYGIPIIVMSIFFNLLPTIITMIIGKMIG